MGEVDERYQIVQRLVGYFQWVEGEEVVSRESMCFSLDV